MVLDFIVRIFASFGFLCSIILILNLSLVRREITNALDRHTKPKSHSCPRCGEHDRDVEFSGLWDSDKRECGKCHYTEKV